MGNHWYDTEGNPKYQINKVGSKELKDTTLSDARKHGFVPSVTTVSGILAKPMVERWKIDLLLNIICDPEINNAWLKEHKVDDWKKYILGQAKLVWEAAAIRGTEVHDKLENYFKVGSIDASDSNILVPAINLLSYQFNGQKWISEAGFAHKSGFGGKVDLHAKSKKHNGIVVDFKTKHKEDLDKKSVYPEYCMQLAAYRLGLDIPDAECYNLIISTSHPGNLYLHKWDEVELKEGLKKFNLLLEYWKLSNNYNSAFEDDDEN